MQYLLVELSGCSAPPVDEKMPRFRPETRPGQTPYLIFLEVTHNLIFLALHVFYSHWKKVRVCVCACMRACVCAPYILSSYSIHITTYIKITPIVQNTPATANFQNPTTCNSMEPHTDRPRTLLVQVNFTAFGSTKVLPNSLKLPSPPKLHTTPCKPLAQSGMTEVPSTVVASDTV